MSTQGEEKGTNADDSSLVALVVDDEEPLANLYSSWLAESYEVRTAYGGEEAIDLMDETVDIVFLDRRMPRLTGDEVLEHIMDVGYDCRVVMATAVNPGDETDELEFDGYLVKPIDKSELVGTAQELCEQ